MNFNLPIANGSDFPLESLHADSSSFHSNLRMSTVLDTVRGSFSTESSVDTNCTAVRNGSDFGDRQLEREKHLRVFDRLLLAPLFTMAMLHGFNKNVSHAKTMGFHSALGIDDNHWSILLMTFYLGFIASTVIVVMCFRKTGSIILWCLCAATVLSGLVTMANAAVVTNDFLKAWMWVAMTRFIQGSCEGVFSAMMVTYLIQFYKSTQLANRMLFFFLVPGLSSSVGALYAFACVHWTHVEMSNWQVFFTGEGLLTVVTGIISFLILPKSVEQTLPSTGAPTNDPDTSSRSAKGFAPEHVSVANLYSLIHNPAACNWMLIDVALGAPATMVFLYLPQIIMRIGFSIEQANLMTCFPYLFAVTALILLIRIANDYSKANIIAFIFGLQSLGFGLYRLTFLSQSRYTQYIAYSSTFLMTLGIGTTNVLAAKHFGPLIKSNEQRLFLNTLGVGLINTTGIITSWVFRSQSFRSEEMTIVFVVLGLLASVLGERMIRKQDEGLTAQNVHPSERKSSV